MHPGFRLRPRHGIGQHFCVQLITDRIDLTALFATQQVARATQFQVAHRQLEACAQLGVFLQSVQALSSIAAEFAVRGGHEIGVGLTRETADAATDLMELGQAKTVGVVHEQGVGVGDVDAAFDDRGRHQAIERAVTEGLHDAVDAVFVHLPVNGVEPHAGHELAQAIGELVEVFDLIVDHEHLALAIEFALAGVDDQLVIPWSDASLDRHARSRRFGQHADVTQAEHRKMQRAGNRGRAEGEHIRGFGVRCSTFDVRRFGLRTSNVERRTNQPQLFFLFHPEAVFFVDHQQPEIGELQIIGEDRMRADQDAHLARGDFRQHFAAFFGTAKPIQASNGGIGSRESLSETFQMLLGQQRGGRQHRDLKSGVCSLERRAHGDFGFSESDIAAQQTIHGDRTFHVGGDFAHRSQLILGFLKWKGRRKAPDFRRVGRIGDAAGGDARRLRHQQFARHVLDGFFRTCAFFRPRGAADGRQLGRTGTGADEFLHQVDGLDGHIQLGFAGKFQQQEIFQKAALFQRRHAAE